MSKKNMTKGSGKQIYTNQIFNKGMLYTSSEMPEGYTKVLNNFDIAPVGDSIVPRVPVKITNSFGTGLSKHTYPVSFNQSKNKQHYINFKHTVTEEDYINKIVANYDYNEFANDSIIIHSRNSEGLNDETCVFEAPSTPNDVEEPTTSLINNMVDLYSNDLDHTIFKESLDGVVDSTGVALFSYDFTFPKVCSYLGFSITFTDYNQEQEIRISEYESIILSLTYEDDGKDPYLKLVRLDNGSITADDFGVVSLGHGHALKISNATGVNYEFEPYDLSNYNVNIMTEYEVHDGDTIYKDNIGYRFLTINTPEINSNDLNLSDKWGNYATYYMTDISDYINAHSGTCSLAYIVIGTDAYDRKLTYFFIKYGDYYYYIQEILVRNGLATIDYVYSKYDFVDKLSIALKLATDEAIKIHSDTEVDPYYPGGINRVLLDTDGYGDFEEGYLVEAVSIVSNKTISPGVTNKIDDVNFVKIDYLDAIGFIGRVIETESGVQNIFYQGVMYLSYEDGNFKLKLPENDLEGYSVNIVDAVAGGYNLLNKNVINTSSTYVTYEPTYTKAVFPVDTSSDTKIIKEATYGSVIKLLPISNYSYYQSDILPKLDNAFSYTIKAHVDEMYVQFDTVDDANSGDSMLGTAGYGTVYYEYTITKGNDYSIILKGSVIDDKIKYTGFIFYVDSVTLNYIGLDYSKIIAASGTNIYYGVSSLINNVETYNAYGVDLFTLKTTSVGKSTNYIENVSLTLSPNFTYLDDYDIKLESKWQVGTSSDFVDISDYKILGDITNLDEYYNFSKIDGEYPDGSFQWQINSVNDLFFKYIMTPVYVFNTTAFDLDDYINEGYSRETISAQLEVDDSYTTIDSESITSSTDIASCTRLTVFNRQVCLYGPYTSVNALFFSKFENEWYFAFPYNTIDVDESIIYVKEYSGNLVLFGKYNIYMIQTTGAISSEDTTLTKVYDGLSINSTDINLVKQFGTHLVFFSNNVGYVMSTNKYYDDPTYVTVSKLTDNINNCLYNPDPFIRTVAGVQINTQINNIIIEPYLYIDTTNIILVHNYTYTTTIDNVISTKNLCVFYRYNQLNKYWTTYSFKDITNFICSYVCEPNFNYQFLIKKDDNVHVLYFDVTTLESYKDYGDTEIETIIDSGFLSVDNMKDKRFKNLFLDFNNIKGKADINIDCSFFVDSQPILLAMDTSSILADEFGAEYGNLDSYGQGKIVYSHVTSEPEVGSNYGINFEINNVGYSVSGRHKCRIDLSGKGRMPSFVIKLTTEQTYELLTYALIYKEKSINIRR